MTSTLFVMLLTTFAVITGICTEGAKKILNEFGIKYISNVIVFVIACIVGIGGTAIYYVLAGIAFTAVNVVCMILMGLATSIGAMVGYDKVIQTIQQIKPAQ